LAQRKGSCIKRSAHGFSTEKAGSATGKKSKHANATGCKQRTEKTKKLWKPNPIPPSGPVLQPRHEKGNHEIVAIDDIESGGHRFERTQGQMLVPRGRTGERVRVRTQSVSEKSAHTKGT